MLKQHLIGSSRQRQSISLKEAGDHLLQAGLTVHRLVANAVSKQTSHGKMAFLPSLICAKHKRFFKLGTGRRSRSRVS